MQETALDWWGLYCAAFPAEERRGRAMHEQALRDAHFHACRLEESGEFIGLLAWWQWEGMLYIEHLAIVADKRGMGYGHKVLDMLQERGLDIILEIEPVCDRATARRMSFYRSCGFQPLPFPHIQRAYQLGCDDMPLLLLGASVTGAAWDGARVAQFEELFAQGPMRYRDACSTR